MKSKKILGLLLACALGFSVLPGKAFAKDINSAVPGIQYVAPDVRTIIDNLAKDGLINENTTEEELYEMLSKYLKTSDKEGKISLNEKIKREKILNRINEFGIKKEKNINKSMKKGMMSLEVPNRIQEEDFTGKLFVAKPLVILVDFPDYGYDKMQEESLRFKFEDYSTNHFQKMLFNDESFEGPNGEELITMKEYYMQQSGGSYTVDGSVTGWYTAEHPTEYYGGEVKDASGEVVEHDKDPRAFVREALKHVANDPAVDLSQYDIEDRYDFDNDGNYNEPDGIIDHVFVIHAGMGQEQGGGLQGGNAIWSHNWVLGAENFMFTDHQGREWGANDYTLQPQSGAVGVFAHEFGHDLGLPDEYDTSGRSVSGSPVGSWSIMSAGSWCGELSGAEPSGFSAWAKEFLQASMPTFNWLKGATIDLDNIPAEGYSVLLDEASSKGVNNDVVRIDLPAYTERIIEVPEGEMLGYSTKGNMLDTSMTMNVDLTGKTTSKLTFKTNYAIEQGWDWASIAVAPAGTDEYEVIPGNLPLLPAAEGAAIVVENGITGASEGWVDAEFDLSKFAGQNIDIRFRYQTDPAAVEAGWFIDQVKVEADSEVIFAENFEGDVKAEFDGFKAYDGTATYNHYYLAEWRSHNKADEGLQHAYGPIAYDPGLVLWYVNNDKYNQKNHVGDHPGEGFLSVVDADQQIDTYYFFGRQIVYADSDVRLHDAAFGLEETGAYEDVRASSYMGFPLTYTDKETFMNPYFSDAKDYTNGYHQYMQEAGVKLENYGLRIYVTGQSKDKSVARIHIMRDQK